MKIDIAPHAARSFIALTLFLSFISPALAAPTSATSPSPSPVATACATVEPGLADDVVSAFSSDLSSAPIQRFIALLGSASEAAQADVVKRASAAVRSSDDVSVRARLANVCPNATDVVGFSRSVIVISHDWTDPGLANDKRAEDLTVVLQAAISALAHPDALTPEDRLTAIAPFQALENGASRPSPTPTASGPCLETTSPSRPIRFAPLRYPPIAQASRAAGEVYVKVSLSETGGVRSATLFKKSMGDDAGAQALVDAAIIVASASTYQADREKCVPSAGLYVFRAQFQAR